MKSAKPGAKTSAKRTTARRRPAAAEKPVREKRPRNLNAAELRALNAWVELLPVELLRKAFAEVGAKALLVPAFRTKLLADPRKALRGIGVGLPPHTRLHVHESSARTIHLVLPPVGGLPRPRIVISDRDLKSARETDPVAMGDTDTVAVPGDYFRDPQMTSDVVKNDGVAGDIANAPPGQDDILKVPNPGDAGRDPHPARDNPFIDA